MRDDGREEIDGHPRGVGDAEPLPDRRHRVDRGAERDDVADPDDHFDRLDQRFAGQLARIRRAGTQQHRHAPRRLTVDPRDRIAESQNRYRQNSDTPATGTNAASSEVHGERSNACGITPVSASSRGHNARHASGSASQNPFGRVRPAANPQTATHPSRPASHRVEGADAQQQKQRLGVDDGKVQRVGKRRNQQHDAPRVVVAEFEARETVEQHERAAERGERHDEAGKQRMAAQQRSRPSASTAHRAERTRRCSGGRRRDPSDSRRSRSCNRKRCPTAPAGSSAHATRRARSLRPPAAARCRRSSRRRRRAAAPAGASPATAAATIGAAGTRGLSHYTLHVDAQNRYRKRSSHRCAAARRSPTPRAPSLCPFLVTRGTVLARRPARGGLRRLHAGARPSVRVAPRRRSGAQHARALGHLLLSRHRDARLRVERQRPSRTERRLFSAVPDADARRSAGSSAVIRCSPGCWCR